MLHIPYSLFVLVGVALGRLMVAQAMGGAEVWGNHKVLVALLVGNNLESSVQVPLHDKGDEDCQQGQGRTRV